MSEAIALPHEPYGLGWRQHRWQGRTFARTQLKNTGYSCAKLIECGWPNGVSKSAERHNVWGLPSECRQGRGMVAETYGAGSQNRTPGKALDHAPTQINK